MSDLFGLVLIVLVALCLLKISSIERECRRRSQDNDDCPAAQGTEGDGPR